MLYLTVLEDGEPTADPGVAICSRCKVVKHPGGVGNFLVRHTPTDRLYLHITVRVCVCVYEYMSVCI